jgi:GDPmannose 4,6-dehydratase
MPTAVIFGVTGQDGSYLADLLLSKGYYVAGVARRVSVPSDGRVRHLLGEKNFRLVPGDVTDFSSVYRVLAQYAPDEVYNLAAQSHVKVSFDEPLHTWDVTAKGCLTVLEAIRCIEGASHLNLPATRFYQASSSEMFGAAWSIRHGDERFDFWADSPDHPDDIERAFQDEQTPFRPNSPYAVAKLAAHNAVRVYRESYGVFACSGILFNHESPRRGEQFVTRKVARYAADFARGRVLDPLLLGNLDARRDWGHARDYVRAMWLMLQQEEPDDYVVATGESHTVREFVDEAFRLVHRAPHFRVDPDLLRPLEVNYLRGDAGKARRKLGWAPMYSFQDLVKDMVEAELGCGEGG